MTPHIVRSAWRLAAVGAAFAATTHAAMIANSNARRRAWESSHVLVVSEGATIDGVFTRR